MKKIQLVLASLLALFAFTACSNSDDNNGSDATGYAIFFHAITDAAQLDLNGDDRDYGSVDYESFSRGILLEAKTWDLEVVDPDPSDSSGDTAVLNTDFTVVKDERRIYALTGTLSSPVLRTLLLAEDTEADGADGEDEDNIYINISHIDSALPETLSVFFLDDDELSSTGYDGNDVTDLDTLTPEASLAYGATSKDLVFASSSQRLVIVNQAGSTIVFDSGDKSLKDAFYQTLLITDSSSSSVAVHYYGLGGVDGLFNEIWRDSSLGAAVGYLKLVNLLKNLAPSAVDINATVNNLSGVPVSGYSWPVSLPFVNANSGEYTYYALPVGGYRVTLDETGGTNYNVQIEAGVAKTLYFFGRLDDMAGAITTSGSPKLVIDDKRQVSSNAKLQFVHLWYQEDEEDLVTVNVHLLDSSNVLASDSTSVLNNIVFNTISNVSVTNDADYNLEVTTTDNITTYDWIDFPLAEGDVKQVLLHEGESGGAAVIDMTQSLPSLP